MSGRFDALTRLEQEKKPSSPPASVVSAAATTSTEPLMEGNGKLQADHQRASKSVMEDNCSPTADIQDKPEKYSTLLSAEHRKKIKMHAALYDMKDHDVVAAALTEYFDKHK